MNSKPQPNGRAARFTHMAAKQKGLGRGLGALITDRKEPSEPKAPAPTVQTPEEPAGSSAGIIMVQVRDIVKSPWQPRREFAPEPLRELIDSVAEHGVLQPLLVRRVNSLFELIAGERRYRAAEAAGLPAVPAIVLDVPDQEALELALIENLQRQDLNIIEEAEGYFALAEKFGLTQEKVAERVGKPRATVANCLRLLGLPNTVKQLLAEGSLSAGHAKVLLGLESSAEQEQAARETVADHLSVRSLERLVARMKRPARKKRAERTDMPADHVKYLCEKIGKHFSTSVDIVPSKTLSNGKKTRGSIELHYYSNEDLDRILEQLGLADDF